MDAESQPHLRRILGFRDLVLLGIVAVFNLNLVPPVAAGGFSSLFFWGLGLAFFFLPQGVAVAEFAVRYPGEGGIYLWTKKMFGERQGFLCGWFYWTTNVFYIPTLLVYLIGIVVFETGARGAALSGNVTLQFGMALALLWLVTCGSIRGLRVNQWINNAGGLAAMVTTLILIGTGIAVYLQHSGMALPPTVELVPTMSGWRALSALGVVCLGLVGLELGSIMGDEIQDPQRTVPKAALCAGLASGFLYVAATLVVLLALPVKEIGVVTGVLQAFASLGAKAGLRWMHLVVAAVLAISICGALSAWLSGGGRIPFVAGVDRYLPSQFSRVHRKWGTPYVALVAQSVASSFAIGISFAGQGVKLHEAYEVLLALAVLTQMIPFVYLFGSLIKVAGRPGGICRSRIWVSSLGVCGLAATLAAIATAFIPPADIQEMWRYEVKLVAGLAVFSALPVALFRHGAVRKAALSAEQAAA